MSQNDYKTASSLPQVRLHDDEELHRYVTDEMPRTAKMSSSTAGGVPPSQAALMVRAAEKTRADKVDCAAPSEE